VGRKREGMGRERRGKEGRERGKGRGYAFLKIP